MTEQKTKDAAEPPLDCDVSLLPCPFCGAEPMIYDIDPHEHTLQIGNWKMPDHPGSAVVECGCGAGLIDDTRWAVTKRWNMRANAQGKPTAANEPNKGRT